MTTGARLIALAYCLVAFQASAQTAPKQGDWSYVPKQEPFPFMNYTWGNRSCDTWLEARANRHMRGLEVDFYGFAYWTDGFLTAYNYFVDPNGDIVGRRTDPEGMYAWIDQYCKGQPTVLFAVVVNQFIEYMKQQPR
jgi:hypothetical protein